MLGRMRNLLIKRSILKRVASLNV
ncbi:hypothetical protein Gorai_008838 [Gossypium raimondii]|uniref:Uncharacterized protein n=1 Tax=Gossypium raimondii TaxID=29730 RepID=A0A7J8PRD2_GOSRA|nr:hypothetical protein [Gossypium raimondii]